MDIVVGLGNPGAEYAGTPHSIGFDAVDAVAAAAGAEWEPKRAFSCLLARASFAGRQVLLVKPQTYMNLSGESVAPVAKYHNAKPRDVIVIHDDIDLPLGRVRIRVGGSCGGHNGVRNIIERLGSPGFARLKLGVGKDRSNVIGHVLGKFPPAAREIASALAAKAPEIVEAMLRLGPDRAMNLYNSWSAAGKESASLR